MTWYSRTGIRPSWFAGSLPRIVSLEPAAGALSARLPLPESVFATAESPRLAALDPQAAASVTSAKALRLRNDIGSIGVGVSARASRRQLARHPNHIVAAGHVL